MDIMSITSLSKERLSIIILIGILFICSTQFNTLVCQDVGEYILALEEDTHPSLILDGQSEVLSYKSIFKDLNLWKVTLRSTDKKSAWLANLSASKKVRYIHASATATNRLVPNDSSYPQQWALPTIGMPDAWDITTGGPNAAGHDIVVGILDDGYQVDHTDLQSAIWVNETEIEDNGLDDDGNGFIDDRFGWNVRAENDDHLIGNHGTSVAGIIGAASNNDNQMTGINWDVKMMLTSSGRLGEYSLPDIVKSYEYIYEQRKLYNNTAGAQGSYVVVTNYSGGIPERFPEDFPSWCEVLDALGSVGIINVGSTANDGVDVDVIGDLPSTCPSEYLIVVTNTGRLNEVQQNAGFGSVGVDLGAPGNEVLSLSRNDGIDEAFFGTSASAPHVAGVISLMYSVMCDEAYQRSLSEPETIALAVKAAILEQVTPESTLSGITVTGGVLNAAGSIEAIDATLGDCCEITISEVNITDGSCINANDAILSIEASGLDLTGSLAYDISSPNGSGFNQTNALGTFNQLPADTYNLNISDDQAPLCTLDTTIVIGEEDLECPFGTFAISDLRQDNVTGLLTIAYDLDEQKDITIQIHDSIGRLIYSLLVRPSLNDGRTHEVITASFPGGIYHASILANGVRDVASFVVAH